MSGEVSVQAVVDSLHRFIAEVNGGNGISHDVAACLSPIARAIEELGGFSDEHADRATSLAASAAERARTVAEGDLPRYVASGRELIRRLQS
ncbi:hypothetical protein [Acidipropionibacterium virtanenii]|uniref:Uncharacterized protein n=1 Tax=Acidipropionibacterium virtanenii TaxID=2057246 RepID=A0A344UT50_9ACTN|nr:hypothetical protein [Acidipropionibacterium virtanenii]AXE38448.1 hypothetical protein JS278_01272 [Acidipropionibacterium virtanenii]